MADLHFGHSDPRAIECIERFLKEQAGKINLIVVAGDWTQRARASQFRAAREFIERIKCPILSVPGNHDVPLYNIFARFLWPLGGYNRMIVPVTVSNFLDEEFAVAGISTVNPYSVADGRISAEEIERVSNFFRSVPKGVLRILCAHHPLYDSGANVWMKGCESFGELGIDVVLSGHMHRHSVALAGHHQRKILSVVSGTSTSDRLRGDSNGFHWIEVSGRIAYVKSYSLEEAGFILPEGATKEFHL